MGRATELAAFRITRCQFPRDRVIGDSQVRTSEVYVAAVELIDGAGRVGLGFAQSLFTPLPALVEIERYFAEEAWPSLDGRNPAIGPSPTGIVSSSIPSLARSFVTVSPLRLATQMLVPSKASPTGKPPTAKTPSCAPSLARSLVSVSSSVFATQTFSPSKIASTGPRPVAKLPSRDAIACPQFGYRATVDVDHPNV